jgi:replicative DNA helicase
VLDELARAERGEIVTRIPTGIAKLDRILLGGLAAGHLVVPCGLTSMGKSSWAFQVAFRGAEERQIPALIFTLEMSRAEAFVKGAATLSRVGTSAFAHPAHGTAVDWRTVNPAAARVAKLKDLVRIEEHRAIGQIVAVSTAWRAQHPGPAIIVVDLLQKVRGVRAKNANRQEEILGVAATLKDLAKDLGLAVVAPGQLDNDPAKEKRPPRIGDMRDSKAIEHEADVVIGIHRDRLVEAGSAELIVLKHRGGRVGKATVGWRGEWQGFENPEPGSDDGEDD